MGKANLPENAPSKNIPSKCQMVSLTFIASEWFFQYNKIVKFFFNISGRLGKIQPLKILWAARPKSEPLAARAISGAKLHTAAASNNRDHALWSLYYCLFAPGIFGCCSSRTLLSWWTAHSARSVERLQPGLDLLVGCIG